jgi:hypothetical protein
MMEKDPFFDEICTKLNVDSSVRKNAFLQLTEIASNTILSVSTQEQVKLDQNNAGSFTTGSNNGGFREFSTA